MNDHPMTIYVFVALSLISILILALCVVIPDHLSPLIGDVFSGKPDIKSNNDNVGEYQQNVSSVNGLTGISLYNALDITYADPDVREWLSSHPGYGISQAGSGHMGMDGLSYEWHVMFAQGKDAMIVTVEYGNVTGAIEHSSYSTGIHVMDKSEMQDSSIIMKNLSFLISRPDTGNYLVSFDFYSEPDGGRYELTYSDPFDNSRNFEIIFNARDGSIISSDFKGDWWLGA
ncbi:hypothetical protein CUJ83_03915 [Methanocella sp. CWC-04]|uniref:Uncharacterized protein n=1 Tax=Methanooceanicella nereidis TaxID=2052831 RepID=A0AAP2RAW1_9EURY|nr:hypothetical protein [Methanocella sp. CWC-04]MCD1294139.1 hypothetical protein [Methanocella sp. CWC-04]